jgi:hypothetical protein
MNNGEAVYLTEHYMGNGTKWQIQEVIKNSGTSQYVLFRQSLPY